METILFGIRKAFTAAPMHTLRGHGLVFVARWLAKSRSVAW